MATALHKRDYYEILGVDRAATQEQIKQAYRRLALQWHPDRNSAPEATDRFKEIAEAYAVLSDPTKRRQYDTAGHAGISERWSNEDLFRDFAFGDFFGGRFADLGGIFGDLFGERGRRETMKPQGANLHFDLSLTLEDAAGGGERVISIIRCDRCQACGGSGAKAGTQPAVCGECQGSGQKQQIKTNKGMKLITITSCGRCSGKGQIIECPCPACGGTGSRSVPHAIKLHVPRGIDDGMVLRLAGQGEPAPPGGLPGDLLVRVRLQRHHYLQRDADDLYTRIEIDFASAALGTKVDVPGLDQERLKIMISPGTQSGTRLRLRGRGMPRLRAKGKGDLYVIVEVRTPTDLTPRQRELLQEFKMETNRKATAAP